jgi:hypothetical protein
MNKGTRRIYFTEYVSGALLAGCFAILISFSTANSLKLSEHISIVFAVIAIPLLIFTLIFNAMEKHGEKMEPKKDLARLRASGVIVSLIAFGAYFISFSWWTISGFIISIISALYLSKDLTDTKNN